MTVLFMAPILVANFSVANVRMVRLMVLLGAAVGGRMGTCLSYLVVRILGGRGLLAMRRVRACVSILHGEGGGELVEHS